eukprot:g22079.t1
MMAMTETGTRPGRKDVSENSHNASQLPTMQVAMECSKVFQRSVELFSECFFRRSFCIVASSALCWILARWECFLMNGSLSLRSSKLQQSAAAMLQQWALKKEKPDIRREDAASQ